MYKILKFRNQITHLFCILLICLLRFILENFVLIFSVSNSFDLYVSAFSDLLVQSSDLPIS